MLSFNLMVEYLDQTFSALSDATRRDILSRLALGEATVSEIAEPYEMSLNAVSKTQASSFAASRAVSIESA